MNKYFESIINLIFPPRCEVCRTGSAQALCPRCFEQVKFMKPHLGIHSVSIYDGPLRHAIHRFKFNKRKRLAEPLGILMVHYIAQTPTLNMEELDLIVPVPLHKKRLRERGFNQAELLGRVISRYHSKPVLPALERHKETKAQFELGREERFSNIIDAFRVIDNYLVQDKRILLLDDIYTTGSTIAECAKTLKQAGARRVEVLTLSRAIENHS